MSAPISTTPNSTAQKSEARIGLTVLGATGTIGVNTLDVVARHPQRYKIVALTANHQVERLFEQCLVHEPEFAVMADAAAAEKLEQKLRNHGQKKTGLCDGGHCGCRRPGPDFGGSPSRKTHFARQ